MVRKVMFCKEPAWELRSTALSCKILPQHGGKVVSLCRRENNFELLFQNPEDEFKEAQRGSPFELFEACGFDDAFPSVDSGIEQIGGKEIEYPDHGEIWSAQFDSEVQEQRLYLTYKSTALGYLYEKWFELEGDTLICKYRITNQGEESFPYLWVCHCLVVYMPDMRLVYPKGTKLIENVIASEKLGAAGTTHPFQSISDNGYDFTRVPEAKPGEMEKYYVHDPVIEGSCGYRYPSAQMAADIIYDAKKLPYLGFWITTGGYRGDKNCAFEPATGYYDSIEKARKNNKLGILMPGSPLSFEIRISLYPWKTGKQNFVKGEENET